MNLFNNDHEILLDVVTQDMKEWLRKTCSGRHYVNPNMVRFRYAGPSVPLSKCMRQQGWKIVFEDEKELLMFKVACL